MSRLARRLRQESDRKNGLTTSQMMALGRLGRPGAATLTGLATGEPVRPQSMARTVDAPEADGLIARSPHPTDRRQNMITLTDSGRAVVARDRHAREAWPAKAMAAVLSPEERDLVVRAGELMDRLAEYAGVPERV